MVGGYSYYANYCPEYRAVLNKGIELGFLLPSIGQQVAQDTLMRQIVAAGMFTPAEIFYVLQTDSDINFGRINWRNPDLYTISFPGALTPYWVKNLGWTGRPDQDLGCYGNTGWIPSTGVTFTQNSAGLYTGRNSGYGGNGYVAFCESGTSNTNRVQTSLLDRGIASPLNGVVWTAANQSAANHRGLIGGERSASNSSRVLVNGVQILTNTTASAARSTNPLKICGIPPEDLPASPYPVSHITNSDPIQFIWVGGIISSANQVLLQSYLMQYQNTFMYMTYTTVAGANNYTVPAGVTQLLVECWGGGGASRGFPTGTATRTGAGGAGAGYSASIISVTPAAVIPYIVGAGGIGTTGAGGSGGDTSWNAGQILAKGGQGGTTADGDHANGGDAAAGIGDIKYSGGNGGLGGLVLATSTGGGGSAAGAVGPGPNGLDSNSQSLRGRYGIMGPGSCGATQVGINGTGLPGTFGSGGSGSRRTSGAPVGAAGGDGYIRVSWPKQY